VLEVGKLQVYENKVLRTMSRCKKDEVSEQFTVLHSEENML